MEDIIPASPIKRRKLEESQATNGYNSADDSGDDLFADYETQPTLLLQTKVPQSLSSTLDTQRLPSQSQRRLTQPTQIIDRATSKPESSSTRSPVVQVAASSPLKPPSVTSPQPATVNRLGGRLANLMAPPGTAYRQPAGVSGALRPPVINISDDDEPPHPTDSSDEEPETRRRADIKPTKFTKGGRSEPSKDRVAESPIKVKETTQFRDIASKFSYQPLPKGSTYTGTVYDPRNRDDTSSKFVHPPKRSADVMANAYGGSSRPSKQPRQSGPAPAKPVPQQDKPLDDITDFGARVMIEKMRKIYPWVTVLACENVLVKKKGNYEDAMEYLSEHPDASSTPVDLTLSDDELAGNKTKIQRVAARQQVKAPSRSIQEKWSSTQAVPKPPPTSKSDTTVSPVTTPNKPRKRLMQGRKHTSSPILPSPQPTVTANDSPTESPTLLSSGSDTAASESEADLGTDDRVLSFLNSCSAKELAELTSVKREDAELIILHRPYKSLRAIDAIRSATTKSGKGSKGRAVGERIVEKCQDMFHGYEAVDQLVKECEALGQPVVDDMKKWGVDVFGKDELDMIDLDGLSSKNSEASKVNETGLVTPAEEDSDTTSVQSRQDNLKKRIGFIAQPALMSESVTLKDYQVVGINWLALLFRKKLSCILADDMGLGKTCQVIGFLAHLSEIGVKGPHLVVVPPATLENWLREFSVFCPKLKVEPYYGSLAQRPEIRYIIETNPDINVVVTTYTMAKQKDDLKWLRKRSFCACVFDEGHMLKNSKSEQYNQLIRIPAKFRLLLTGTPLQNNLRELISLLAFIMPNLFSERKEDLEYIFSHKAKTNDENHDALLSAQRTARARSMLKPFVLRRKKHQVLATMPKKTRRIEYCELNPIQKEIYDGEIEAVKKVMEENLAAGKKAGTGKNIMMKLRQAAIHPLLSRRIYNDELLSEIAMECLKEEQWEASDPDYIFEDMTVMNDAEINTMCEDNTSLTQFALKNDEWMESGKVVKLCELLLKFREDGDRCLVFSQFTLVLNILDYVMETLRIRFFRLDGSTKVEERQDMIDEFYTDTDITVFMLSTKAGGTGINLACANKVIIFDMSFNPQDDIQAENRAHRVGTTRDVEVIRLVTKGTIEEQIYKMGESKVLLDEKVAGVDEEVEEDQKTAAKKEKAGEIMLAEILAKELKGGSEDVVGTIDVKKDDAETAMEDGDWMTVEKPVNEADMGGIEMALR
jgi:SWI/SNF-related matrix-associated actin-dependent regulator of chromatin subfamily A containing DEAD/H box 1